MRNSQPWALAPDPGPALPLLPHSIMPPQAPRCARAQSQTRGWVHRPSGSSAFPLLLLTSHSPSSSQSELVEERSDHHTPCFKAPPRLPARWEYRRKPATWPRAPAFTPLRPLSSDPQPVLSPNLPNSFPHKDFTPIVPSSPNTPSLGALKQGHLWIELEFNFITVPCNPSVYDVMSLKTSLWEEFHRFHCTAQCLWHRRV